MNATHGKSEKINDLSCSHVRVYDNYQMKHENVRLLLFEKRSIDKLTDRFVQRKPGQDLEDPKSFSLFDKSQTESLNSNPAEPMINIWHQQIFSRVNFFRDFLRDKKTVTNYKNRIE